MLTKDQRSKMDKFLLERPDDYDFLDKIPRGAIVTMQDVQDVVQHSRNIDVIRPQMYDHISNLNDSDDMFEDEYVEYGYFYGSSFDMTTDSKTLSDMRAVSGYGLDEWLKANTVLYNHLFPRDSLPENMELTANLTLEPSFEGVLTRKNNGKVGEVV